MKCSRIKKLLFIFVVMLFQIKYVNAASYDLVLETEKNEVEKNSNITINISLKNINDITSGLSVCQTTITSTEGVTINSITGINSWNVTQGLNLILETSTNVTRDTSIATINATVTDNGNITLYNTNCRNENSDFTTSNHTLQLTICENAETNEEVIEKETNIETNTNVETSTTVENSQTNVETSTTVENPQTGVYSILIYMLIIVAFTLLIVKLNNKYNLFRKKM